MNRNVGKNFRVMIGSFAIVLMVSACSGGSGGDKPSVPLPIPTPAPTPGPTPNPALCGGVIIGDEQNCITVNDREIITYATDSTEQYTGIAIFLHGAPGNPLKVSNIFGSKMIADKYNLVALSPQGNSSSYEWNSSNKLTGSTPDVDFLLATIDDVQSRYSFSENKVYIFGYSAGGFMAYKLACQAPERLTAVIALAGQFRGDFDACTTSTPVALHHLHSSIDKDVPFAGRDNGTIASVPETITFWQQKNGCSVETQETVQGGVTATSARTVTNKYTGCSKSVALSSLENVSHEDEYVAESLLATYDYLFE